jgi:hypothetical protein
MIERYVDFAHWHWMNYATSFDFLKYYAERHPEPPENPWHADLGMILGSLKKGENDCKGMLDVLKPIMASGNRWRRMFKTHGVRNRYENHINNL